MILHKFTVEAPVRLVGETEKRNHGLELISLDSSSHSLDITCLVLSDYIFGRCVGVQ